MYVSINEKYLKVLWQSLAHKEDCTIIGKNLQINLKRKIIEDFIQEDFVTVNISSWFKSDLNMLAGKKFDDGC